MNTGFIITDSAAKRINDLVDTAVNEGFRITILGGGCSGFQYEFDYRANAQKDDHVLEHNGAKVFIDQVSWGFVEGSALDYVQSLGSAEFKVKNPSAKANCGCGKSFST